ncbi:hypothetical protein [Hyphomicrobium sp. 2TAF46]|uniref:hypothetical protein n=1 Tax=Hyphomicrobium sp. 2TAF46 TaxID=3233019 RepID=UPI003F922FE4
MLDGIFDRPPDLSQVSRLAWLKTSRFSHRYEPACGGAMLDWEPGLAEFSYVGTVDLANEDAELMSACRSFGPLRSASIHAEGEWRWRHDRAAYQKEIERYREAQAERQAADLDRYEKRLKGLTWEKLLLESPLPRWDEHPPFPPPDFTAAARERLQLVMRELQALGPKPEKAKVRAILRRAVEWFNAKNAEFGSVIETEEREDLSTIFGKLAFVARHPALVEEIGGWRER